MVEQATDKQEQTFGNLINPYTNKPVHTGKSVSFNQNTYDDINYIQAKNNLLKDFNINMTRPQSVNAQALYDIPVIPEFMKEEYQDAYSAGNWLESLNIATPEEIDEWRAMGKMGIGETAQRLKSLKSAKYIPFVGTTAEVGYNLDMLSAVNRLKKGEQISDVERDLLVDYLREIKEIQVRGTTLPSKALTAILESVPYMVEFGVGVAAAPETFGGGLAASGAALTKAAGKKAARKAVAKALQKAAVESTMTGTKKALSMSAAKTLYKNTYDSMLKAGATKAVKEVGMKEAAKIVAKNTPKDMARAAFGSPVLTYMTAKNTVGGVAERQLGGSMQVTDAGEAVFLEPENMALSIMKAFGTSVFDNYTETMGWAFAPVSSYFAKPVRKVLPQKFFTGFEKLVSSRYGMPAAEALKKFGYDGVLEEMGEELLNRFLCQTFGINGLDEYTFDGFMNNVFYANDPEQWLVEAISFAAMGGAAHSAYGISSDVKKRYDEAQNKKIAAKLAELANKRIYSPAEYYLEQGLIKINGSQSEAEKMLREKFEERGVDKNTADDFVNNSSELEIRKQLKQFIDEDEADADKRREKAVNYLADKMLENKSYNNKDMAQKNANLIVTALEKLSETNGIPIEELINNEAPKILNQSMNENADVQTENVSTSKLDAYIDSLWKEYDNLPENYSDTEEIERMLSEIDILTRIKENDNFSDEELAKANELVNELEAADWDEVVKEIRANNKYNFETLNDYLYRTEQTDNPVPIDTIKQIKEIDASNTNQDNDTTLSGIKEVEEFSPEDVFTNSNTEISENVQEEIKENYNIEDVISGKEEAETEMEEETEAEEFEENKKEENIATSETIQFENKSEEGISIQDVGDSLLGNLKRNGKTYTWNELENMNDLLRTKYVAKKYIMLKPDFTELVKQGYSDKSAAFVINVYNRINAKPAKGYDTINDQKIYFDTLNDVMEKTLKFAKEEMSRIDDFKAGNKTDKTLLDIIYPDKDGKNPYNIFTSYPEYNKSAIITGGNKMVSSMYLCRDTENDIEKILKREKSTEENKNTNEDKLTGWRTTFDVIDYYGSFRIVEKKSKQIFHADFKTQQEAEYAAQKLYDAVKKDRYGFTVDFTDMRDYIPRRENNQNVKPEALIEVFGFRGVNFGNWTKQSERQDFVNLAYDSLYDLAELLNLPPKAMSLNGKLGLAFGAQGRSGKAAGHFIPEFNEINMTRKSGAGTLAHEWWHALDWYFGDVANGKDFSGQAATTLYKSGEMRPELYNAFQNLNENIRFAPATYEEIEEQKNFLEDKIQKRLKYYGDNIKNTFKKIPNIEKVNKLVDDIVAYPEKYYDDAKQKEVIHEFGQLLPEKRKTITNMGYFNWLLSEVRQHARIEQLATSHKKETDYLKSAKKLDIVEKGMGIGYWSSKTEMSARAFSSYLLDKMHKREFKNSFLVRSQSGEVSIDPVAFVKALSEGKDAENANILVHWNVTNPDEKQRIFNSFDEIFNTIKYEETDKGYKLYQSAYTGSPSDYDNPSLDFIGTGEGNQAHGYGLYYAENKDVAEGYLKRLSNSVWTYNGKNLVGGEIPYFIDLQRNGKKNRIDFLKSSIERCEREIKKAEEYKKENKFLPYGMEFDYDTNKRNIKYLKEQIKIVKGIDLSKLKMETDGQLFEVDIPETDVLLDEQKTFDEQSDFVKKVLKNSGIKFDNNDTGKTIYEKIGNEFSNKYAKRQIKNKNASEYLNMYGIKGITYDGTSDGRCYVIFDDKAVKILNKYYQEEAQGNLFYDNLKARDLRKVKGYYLPAENLIELFKNADESTIIHEFAHWWLDRLVKYSENNEELSEDVAAVRKWVKNDGGEFTREQHEKFARGFETYIRSGYAKNNRLKKLFEDFKNALLSIYDSILQLGFKKEDMPQIQDLFDRLLTTEHERIKATVFDKIAEIDEKIDNIRENEKEEFKELDEIWKDNIAILNRRSDKKRKVEEYIQLAETIPFRETKETREWKQRYKNATLDILATYSGKSRSWVANSRNWEKLQDLIGQANDGISASNGFLQEWAEFYTDTGVSYENSEVGADEELAQQAFDVMVAGDYNHPLDENYEFRDIDAFVSKIDYLAAKIKTVKGEEKNVVFEALTTLFSKMPDMPDDVMAEISKKLIKAGEELEEDTKEDFNRKVYPSIPIVQQLQFYITKKLNDLKVYNPETRYKMRLNKSHRLYKYIQNVNSVNQAKKQIKKINEFIIDDMRNNQRSLLHKEIQKQIRVNSKLVKVGTMTKGKFDWKTNTCFAELVQMNKMDRKDAEKELGAITQIQDAAKSESRDSFDENETGEFNKSNDFQDILKKEFLQYRSMRLQDLDVIHTIQLLQDILELKEQGRKAKSEEDFISRTQKWNTKNNLLDLLEITKQSGAQFGANWIAGVGGAISLNGGTLANWESLLNAVFNKDTAQKYSILKDEADSDVYARKHMLNFYDRAADIYGFKKPSGFDKFLDYDNMQPLIKLFQEYDNEKYTYMQQVFSINSPDGTARSSIDLSRSQLITMFAWSLNDQLEQRLMTQFGVEQIRDMFENKLSKEDKDLAWALVDTCESMREDINEVFIRTTGLSLPAVQNYFPSKAERVQSDIDMYHDFFVKSTNPSFIKQRKTCNRIPMKPMSPLEILIPHINKTAKYVILSEKVNWLNQIFKDTAIKTKMQEIWGSKNGEKIYQTMINKLAACTFTNYSKGNNLIAGWLDTMSRNYITSSIGFSGKVALGQLLSVVNYAENMPAMTWAKGFKETLKHPVEAFNYMLENCEYLQTRLAGNSQNEVMAILTSEKDKFRTLRNFMTSNVKWGDIIAITLGGKPYVDYLMNEKGMSKEDAFNQFVEDTLRAQQAGTTSSISEWQSAQAKNCLTRMIFAFRNTDIQYERKFWDTLIQAKKGDIDKKEAIKKLFIYKVLNPFMFTSFLQNMSILALFRGIFAGDDDTITTFLKTAVEAIMLGGVNAYGYAGFLTVGLLESLFALFDRDYKHFETTMPVLTDIDHIVQKFTKGDLEFADWVDGIATSSEFFIGVPTSKLVNFVEGAADTIKGNVGVGLSRMAGWGRYTSTKAWTGEPPEKERKKRKKRKK